MASGTTYKGYEIFDGTPEGLAGQALNANFALSADHLDSVANPHVVTALQVGRDTAL